MSITLLACEMSAIVWLLLSPKKDVIFIIGVWNAKVGSQETPGVTGKFGLGVQMKQGKSQQSFALLTMPKPLTVRITINCGKF